MRQSRFEAVSDRGGSVALIVVIGTGGMGREALAWLADIGRGDDASGSWTTRRRPRAPR
jgi:hypothetical protein